MLRLWKTTGLLAPDIRPDKAGMSGQRLVTRWIRLENKGANDFPRVGLPARLAAAS
mgnify:CR=1 FL=1